MEQPKVTSDGAPALIALGALLAYERRHHVIASHSVEAAQLILDAEDALKCRVCSGSGWVAHKHGIDDGYGEADACRACEPARHITTAPAPLRRFRVSGGALIEDDHGPLIRHDELTAWLLAFRAKLRLLAFRAKLEALLTAKGGVQ